MNKKLVAAFLILTLIPTAAIAAPPKPTQAQIDAAKKLEAEKKAAADASATKLNSAKKTLKQLASIATAKQKLYVSAQNELKMKTKRADLAMKHLQIAQASVSSGKRAIGKLAANAYVSGGGFTDLDSILNADGPQDLADRLSALDAVGQNNSTALDRYKSAEVVASSAQKEADVTLEQQRQLALLEESNAGRAVLTPDQSKIWPDTGFTGRSTTRSTEAMRAAAVEYASKQVLAKKRYVWGSEGPTTFDCSGLVYAAYRAAGLGWPNWDRLNSSLYWVSTKRVPLKDLVPGDLLFYSYKPTVNTIHHITIYAGDGMMWEANSKDKGLLYSSIYSVKGLLPYGGRV